MILPGVNEERAVKVADAIRMLVARLQIHHPRSPRKYVTISLGVAEKGDATTPGTPSGRNRALPLDFPTAQS